MAIDLNEIELSPEQKQIIAERAVQNGKPWRTVLQEAIAPKSKGCIVQPIGCSHRGGEKMRTRLTLAPGHRGAKQLLARYGDQLMCVRYRYDEQLQKRFETVELIVEESDWRPQAKSKAGEQIVSIRVAVAERDIRAQVKRAGGIWQRDRQVWDLRYDQVVTFGLEGRIVTEEGI